MNAREAAPNGQDEGKLRPARQAWAHPAFVLGFLSASFALAALPAQYTPVLWRHDRAFIALGMTPLVLGGVLSARRSRPVAATVVGTSVLVVAATVGYKLYGGIGWPDPLDLLMLVALAAAAVGAMSFTAGRAPPLVQAVAAITLAISSLAAFSVVAAYPGQPAGAANQCETRDGVEFCSFPGFEPFIDRWEDPVAAVVRRLPDAVRAGVAPVVQAVDRPRRGAMATPFLDWDRPHSGVAELAVALDAAAWSVGFNEQFQGRRGRGGATCGPAVDDGRNIVVFWLAGQSTPQAEEVLRRDGFGDAISGSTYAAPTLPPSGAEEAIVLLDRDPDEVGALLREHWQSITDGSASGAEVARLLGLPAVALRSADPDQANPRFHTQDCI